MEEGPSPKRHRTVRTQIDAEILAEENVNGAANDGRGGLRGEFAREVVGENRNGSGVNLEVDDRTMAECDERRDPGSTVNRADVHEEIDGAQVVPLPDLPPEASEVGPNVGPVAADLPGVSSGREIAATLVAGRE